MDTLQVENIRDKINREMQSFLKISPILIMKKYNLNEDLSMKICQHIWLNRHLEARKLTRTIEI
jgi:hypothetical protein